MGETFVIATDPAQDLDAPQCVMAVIDPFASRQGPVLRPARSKPRVLGCGGSAPNQPRTAGQHRHDDRIRIRLLRFIDQPLAEIVGIFAMRIDADEVAAAMAKLPHGEIDRGTLDPAGVVDQRDVVVVRRDGADDRARLNLAAAIGDDDAGDAPAGRGTEQPKQRADKALFVEALDDDDARSGHGFAMSVDWMLSLIHI